MYKLEARITSEGGKRDIYALQEQLEQVLSQFSVRYDMSITDNQAIIETKTVSQVREWIPPDDVIDTELSGDDIFMMIEEKKKEE